MSLFKDGFPIIKVLKQNQTRKVDRDKGILNFFLDWNILMTSQKCRTGPFDFEFLFYLDLGWAWMRDDLHGLGLVNIYTKLKKNYYASYC